MTTPNQKTPRSFYVELAKTAYQDAVSSEWKTKHIQLFAQPWTELLPHEQRWHIAFAKAVAKEVNRLWGIG